MRAASMALGYFVLAAAGAGAQGLQRYPSEPQIAVNHLRLPQSPLPYTRASMGDADDTDSQLRYTRTATSEPSAPTFVSFGGVRMDMGNDGPRKKFAHIELEDAHVLGGNISGTFDGRAATLRLSWPTGN